MDINKIILLPGLDKQLHFLQKKVDIEEKSILIVGSNSHNIARMFYNKAKEVIIIVDNQEDLMNMKYALSATKLNVRYMEYSNTDFINSRFNIIYAQGSISRIDRNKILKEFKRILFPDGIICIGEIVSLSENLPKFIKDIWNQSGLSPLNITGINRYYEDKGFEVIDTEDLTGSLKEFYSLFRRLMKETIHNLPEKETKFYKNILNRMKHETDVYLKLGGDKHIGFISLLLRKASDEKR